MHGVFVDHPAERATRGGERRERKACQEREARYAQKFAAMMACVPQVAGLVLAVRPCKQPLQDRRAMVLAFWSAGSAGERA